MPPTDPNLMEEKSESDLWELIASSQRVATDAAHKARLVIACARTLTDQGEINAHLMDGVTAVSLACNASQTSAQAALLLLLRERRKQAEREAGFPLPTVPTSSSEH